jgi:hypothetical protein
MKFSNNARKALAESDTRIEAIKLTPELKEKYRRVAHDLNDWLRERTSGPMEAYMILQFVVQAFEGCYGIRGGVMVEEDDFKSGAKQ